MYHGEHVYAGIGMTLFVILKQCRILMSHLSNWTFILKVQYYLYLRVYAFLTSIIFIVDSNRAAAFLHLVKLSKALADAETTITLKPDWEKVIGIFFCKFMASFPSTPHCSICIQYFSWPFNHAKRLCCFYLLQMFINSTFRVTSGRMCFGGNGALWWCKLDYLYFCIFFMGSLVLAYQFSK